MLRPSRELVVLARALKARRIPFVALKGPAMAVRLGRPPDSRPVRDLDILVARPDVPRTLAVVEELGYKPLPRSNGFMREQHCVRSYPSFCIDLHWHLIGAHIGFPVDIPTLIAESQTVRVHGEEVPLPGDPWLLLITCLYCLHEPPLVEPRYFDDLALLVHEVGEEVWPRFRALARKARALRLCATALRVTEASGRTRLPDPARELVAEGRVAEVRVEELLRRLEDPASWRKERFVTYFRHFLWHGRYREHWFDRLRPLLALPLFLILPEDDDVLRAQESGRSPYLERLLRGREVLAAVWQRALGERRERSALRALRQGRRMLRARNGVELHLLDGEGLLFDPDQRHLLRLAPQLAWLWCAFEEGCRWPEVVQEFQEAFGLSPSAAEALLERTVRELWRLGLLEGAPRPGSPAVPEPPSIPFSGPLPEPRLQVEGAVLRTNVAVHCPDEQAGARVAGFLRGFAAPAQPPVRRRELHLVPDRGGYLLVADGSVLDRAPDLPGLVPQVKAAVVTLALEGEAMALFLHAGMVSWGDAALLLPAAPGSGKTSLTLALARAGFAYHSDEFVMLVGEELRARGIPVPATVKQSAWAMVEEDFPELACEPAHERVDGQICKYLPLSAVAGSPAQERPLPVRWLIFPRFQPNQAAQLSPLPRLQALERLFDQCLALPAELDQSLVAGLLAWLEGLESFELTFGDRHQAARKLARTLDLDPATLQSSSSRSPSS